MGFAPYVFFYLVGLLSCFLLTPFFIWFAHRYRLLDHPAHRKIHVKAVPKTGGLAIVSSVIIASALGMVFFGSSIGYDEIRTIKSIFILGITLMAALVGLVDDIFDLRPRQKFLLQALLVGTFVVLGFRFQILHLPGLKPFELSFLAVPITMFWMLAILNGFNFMDGIDGLAGSVTTICLLGIGGASYLSNGHLPGGIWLSALGVVLAFLFFNSSPPQIYLGDSGSMALGTFTAATLVSLGTPQPDFLDWRLFNTMPLQEPYRFQLITATLLVGYPAVEIVLSTLRRAVKRFSQGRSMESSEQEHIHHILLKAGWSTGKICLSAATIQLVLTSAGLLVMVHQNALATWLILPLLLILVYLAPRLGFFNFIHLHSSIQQPHYLIANHFISMQLAKLQLARSRPEILALLSQTCREFGVKSCRLIIRPDENGMGGLDYLREWDMDLPAEYLDFLREAGQRESPWLGFADQYKLTGGRGGAYWVFGAQDQAEDLDVEYHVLVSGFIREALEAASRMGLHKETLELPKVVHLPHERTSGNSLRKRPHTP